MAMVSLFFGAMAGRTGAIASSGYAKNLRHDIFYKIQEFSFKNIDHFSTSSLVTRLTTDITNIQLAYNDNHPNAGQSADHDHLISGHDATLTINADIALMLLITVPILAGPLIFARPILIYPY